MLSILKNWIGSKANPIGVDFGTDSVKLAQVARHDNEWKLVAAASADVPSHVRHDTLARMTYLSQCARDLLAQGRFVGRQAIIALPSASMFIQHLRMPKMDEDALKKAIPWEAQGKLPIDPNHALLRHHVAGDVFQDQEAKSEVILMAAGRDVVAHYLGAASKAKLDVVGMNVEPNAIIDCFGHIYRRKEDEDVAHCFIDMGFTSTRAIIARGNHIVFARSIPVGGDHFARAVAAKLQVNVDQARLARWQLANIIPGPTELQKKQEVVAPEPAPAEGFALLDAAMAAAKNAGNVDQPPAPVAAPTTAEDQAAVVERAMTEPLHKLVEELDLCRRYYEGVFPTRPVQRLIFVGGEARHRWICQRIAQELGIAAMVGDPIVRMGRISDIGPESGIDRRLPQPNWTVAIGLSLGPCAATQVANAA